MGLPNQIDEYEEDLTSGILPIVCQKIREEPRCNVVDLGTSSTTNCMLFSRNGARVYLDTSRKSLRSEIALGREIEPSDVDDVLGYCPDAIDILMLWNILDYLPRNTIDLLMRRISGIMREGGLIYAMVSQQRYIPVHPATIDVVEEDRLRFQYGPLEKEGPHYAPKQLEQLLPGCRIEKLYLMQNGIQEHLFLCEGSD